MFALSPRCVVGVQKYVKELQKQKQVPTKVATLALPVFIGRTEKGHDEHELNLFFPSINVTHARSYKHNIISDLKNYKYKMP